MAVAKKIKEMMERSSWIRKMFELGAQLKGEHGTDKVCDFSLGNPNLKPPQQFTNALIDIIRKDIPGKHAYMPNAGYADVRNQVAKYVSEEQGVQVKGSHIVMTCGAGGALNIALKTIINPGNTIIVSTPCFMEYLSYTDNHGGRLELVPCKKDFDLDIQAIEKQITRNTAGIIINSPNNPSGRIYPESTIKALGEMLYLKSKKINRPIYLISDEPYRKIAYDGNNVPGILTWYKNSIVISSYSKALSIAGERIGWLAVHPDADDIKNLLNGIILCNRILGFVNAPALMQHTIKYVAGLSVDIDKYKKKRDKLCIGLSRMGYEFIKPEGAFYLFPKAPGGDDLKFVDFLRKELILAVPGSGFGLPGYFRIAYCVEDDVIERSMHGFSCAINAIKSNKNK